MATPLTLYKDPDTSQLFDINFANLLSSGETIASPTISCSPIGLTIASQVVDATGTKVQMRISSGVSGTLYTITCDVTTSDSNVLQGVVQLFVIDAPWLPEMTQILRHLIDDLTNPPTYASTRLGELILVAAQQVASQMSFNNNYTVNVNSLSINPDPVAARDEAFISLVCLYAACILDRAELRTRSKISNITVRDSMGQISTGGAGDAMAQIVKLGSCAQFEKAKLQHQFGTGAAIKGVLTPFSSATLQEWRLGDATYRAGELFR